MMGKLSYDMMGKDVVHVFAFHAVLGLGGNSVYGADKTSNPLR